MRGMRRFTLVPSASVATNSATGMGLSDAAYFGFAIGENDEYIRILSRRYNYRMLKPTEKIWHNGRFIRWEEATIHVLSHVVSYGSSVFEGIRCYSTPNGPAVFRLREHVRRMMDSAKIYRMENLGFTPEQLADAMLELVRVNKMDACYLRPFVLRGYGDIGVYGQKNPVDVFVACWEWGKYLGEEALAQGVDVCVSSWSRMEPNTLP